MTTQKTTGKPKLTKEQRREKYTQLARARRTKQYEKSHSKVDVCFLCRQRGHRLAECPQSKSTAICYRCGSTEHGLADCAKTGNELPYATCFVCNSVGHLARDCPQKEEVKANKKIDQKKKSNVGHQGEFDQHTPSAEDCDKNSEPVSQKRRIVRF